MLNISVNLCVRLSPLTPFCSSQNDLLTSLPVAGVSYRNCTHKPMTCHVTIQRYLSVLHAGNIPCQITFM